MLKDFREIAENLALKFNEIKFWPEIEFNDSDIEYLKQIEGVRYVNSHSLQLEIDKNHAILPSQYILYSICLKPLAIYVKEYLNAFETIKSQNSQNSIGDAITNNTLNYSSLNIDLYSKEIGPKIFSDRTFNLDAKSIVNGLPGSYKIRGLTDFYGSIILKPINIPNASSTILGKFIYRLTDRPDIYDYLEKRFLNKIPYVVKDKHIKTFAKQIFEFLYQYDGLKKIKDFVKKNEDPAFSSIKYKDGSLTSIFKTSQIPLTDDELKFNDDRPRYFSEPLFMIEDYYYYFSTEWTNGTNSRLDLNTLKSILKELYPNFEIVLDNDSFIFKLSESKSLDIAKDQRNSFIQKIFYGAPGTGKSHKIETILKSIPEERKERITFHPEYDYASFVGGYRPASDGKEIKYIFVPQVFTKIYIAAWTNLSHNYYLAIEEINRGNCAEIFGDLFQLLDRNSNYSISPSKDLKDYLEKELQGDALRGIEGGKMKLPANLSILASMNTSDQSLFPMDSAFKRRWSWEYVPINYEKFTRDGESNDSYNFIVELEGGKSFKWIEFIEKVNNIIKRNPNLGTDKCIGNYFIKPVGTQISLGEFINKAIFYLWIDVFKDEEESIFRELGDGITYEDFFPIVKGKELVNKLIDYLGITREDSTEASEI